MIVGPPDRSAAPGLQEPSPAPPPYRSLRLVVLVLALLNLSYFFVEFHQARRIGSVSLVADSIDFLEDASLNILVLLAAGWAARERARIGKLLALILLIPGLETLWTAWSKLRLPLAPDPRTLSLTALGALFINLFCALLLVRFRHHAGSITRAAFLSARNDAFANLAMIATGLITLRFRTGWIDLVVGLGIALMNADAAREVWTAATKETRDVT